MVVFGAARCSEHGKVCESARSTDGRCSSDVNLTISTLANRQTERSTGSARTVLRTLSNHNDNTRNTAFPLRLSTVWCCGGCGGQRHTTGWGNTKTHAAQHTNQNRGVTQLNARGHDKEEPTCNTLEMTMGRWGFVGVQGRQNNTGAAQNTYPNRGSQNNECA
jgi:hypothetical protein